MRFSHGDFGFVVQAFHAVIMLRFPLLLQNATRPRTADSIGMISYELPANSIAANVWNGVWMSR